MEVMVVTKPSTNKQVKSSI